MILITTVSQHSQLTCSELLRNTSIRDVGSSLLWTPDAHSALFVGSTIHTPETVQSEMNHTLIHLPSNALFEHCDPETYSLWMFTSDKLTYVLYWCNYIFEILLCYPMHRLLSFFHTLYFLVFTRYYKLCFVNFPRCLEDFVCFHYASSDDARTHHSLSREGCNVCNDGPKNC
jgi:hypothetical protein